MLPLVGRLSSSPTVNIYCSSPHAYVVRVRGRNFSHPKSCSACSRDEPMSKITRSTVRWSVIAALASAEMVLTTTFAQGNCRTVRMPDGSFMTECPSETPRVPPPTMPQRPAIPTAPHVQQVPLPQNYLIICDTPAGYCTFNYPTPVPSGTTCNCNQGQYIGITR